MPHGLPKCSKCGSYPCTYREIASIAICFDLTDNKFNEVSHSSNPNYQGLRGIGFEYNGVVIDSTLTEPDNIGEVEAECGGCGNCWILRNFKTIDGLIELHGFNKGTKTPGLKEMK
jgi:hypothetical protein